MVKSLWKIGVKKNKLSRVKNFKFEQISTPIGQHQTRRVKSTQLTEVWGETFIDKRPWLGSSLG